MKNIAVFFGGESIEHEVSIITGTLTVNSLDAEKYNGIPIYCSHDGVWYTGERLKDIDGYKKLDEKKLTRVTILAGDNKLYIVQGKKLKFLTEIAVAINCMHGERGEDGSLCGFLNLCKIPVASPDMFASSVAISKINTKKFLQGIRIKTLPYKAVSSLNDINGVLESMSFPLIVKPDCGGSSIGMSIARTSGELHKGILYALRFGERVIIEPFITDFIEINCACYLKDNDICVSECEQPIKRSEILSFDDKYCEGARIFPARISPELSKKIKSITKKVYQNLNCHGVVRIDYIVFNNQVYLNEINSVPGSLSYYLFSETLKGYSELLTSWIIQAERKMAKSQTFIKKFNSSILNISGTKSAKRLKNK